MSHMGQSVLIFCMAEGRKKHNVSVGFGRVYHGASVQDILGNFLLGHLRREGKESKGKKGAEFIDVTTCIRLGRGSCR